MVMEEDIRPPREVKAEVKREAAPAGRPVARKGVKGKGRNTSARSIILLLVLLGLTAVAWLIGSRTGRQGPVPGRKQSTVNQLLARALVEEDAGNMEAAVRTYRQITDVNPAYAPAYNNLANIFQKRGFLDVAILNYRKALDINPNLISARYNLALSYYDKKLYREAAREWRKLLTFDPDSTVAAQTETNIRIAEDKASDFKF